MATDGAVVTTGVGAVVTVDVGVSLADDVGAVVEADEGVDLTAEVGAVVTTNVGVDLRGDVGANVGAGATILVVYRLGQDALLGLVMMYESTDKATLALLSLGVTQDLLKFMP